MRTSLSAVRTALGTIGIVTGAVAAIAKLVQLGKESVELASDLQEVQNVVDTVFGNMSGEIDSFATDAITQFGLSQTAAKQFASTMGAILKSMGFRGQELSDMSTNLAGLAGDLASFYNIDAETAFQKLRAGITGEIEPLRQLGINLSQANLEQFRLSRGITTAYNAMTEQEKAMLRYQYILEATGDAQGDFSRTSGGWANQVRVMREQINAIKAEIGSGLMEILLPVVRGINWLLSQVIRGLQALRRFFSRGKGGTASMDTMTDATAALTSEANAAAGAVGGIGKAAKSAAKAFTTASFDELHQLASDAASAAGGGGGGGGGIGGLVGDIEDEIAALNQATDKTEEGESALRHWVRTWYDAQQKLGNLVIHSIDKAVRSNKILNYGVEAEESRIRGELISQAAYATVRHNTRKFINGVKSFITGSSSAQEGLRRFNEAAVGGWHDIGVALGILSDETEDSTERVSGAFVGAQEKVTSSTYTIETLIKKLAGDPSLKTLQKNIGGVGTKASAAAAEVGEAESAISEHLRLMNMHAEKPISELTGKETGIGTGMTAAAAVVKDAATGKSGSVTASLSAMNTDGGKSVTALGTTVTGLGTSAKNAATEVKAQTVGASGSVKAFLNTMKSDGSTAVEGLRSAISTKFSDATKSASSSSSSIKKSVVDAVNSTKAELSAQKFTDVGQNIKNGRYGRLQEPAQHLGEPVQGSDPEELQDQVPVEVGGERGGLVPRSRRGPGPRGLAPADRRRDGHDEGHDRGRPGRTGACLERLCCRRVRVESRQRHRLDRPAGDDYRPQHLVCEQRPAEHAADAGERLPGRRADRLDGHQKTAVRRPALQPGRRDGVRRQNGSKHEHTAAGQSEPV